MDAISSQDQSPLIDCRGLQCPAPILKLSEAARKHRTSPGTLTVLATDADFPVDLEAWCRTTKSSLVRLEHEDNGVIRAQVRLAGAPAITPTPPASRVAALGTTLPSSDTVRTPPVVSRGPTSVARGGQGAEDAIDGKAEGPPREINLCGIPIAAAMRKLNEVSTTSPGARVTVRSDAAGFEARMAAWATATDTTLESLRRDGKTVIATLRFSSDEAESPAAEPSPAPAPVTRPPAAPQAERAIVPLASPIEEAGTLALPRENRATLLVLKNDLEALLAALMVANASAAQGMEVEVFFAFWGIHLLRGERPRPSGAKEKIGLMQRMMLWMVPKGPARQKLGTLHMGGLGTRILLRLMRKRNILALDQLVAAAASQGVKFRVCSMSMGLMGLGQRDIVDLPNVDFAGVTSFAERASRSAVSLVF